MNTGTADYWRKLLCLDEDVPPSFLSTFNSPFCFLRPFFVWLVTLFLKKYYQIEVVGADHLPDRPPYILASNHQSYLDVPVLMFDIDPAKREEIYIITKKYVFRQPLFALLVHSAARCFAVDAEKDFLGALRIAVKIIKSKKALYIAPEGTRSKTGQVGPFRVGVGVLAVETGVPVIPIYIHGTHEAWGCGQLLPKRGKIKMIFGEPFDAVAYAKEHPGEQAYDVYKSVTEELRQRVVKLGEPFSQ